MRQAEPSCATYHYLEFSYNGLNQENEDDSVDSVDLFSSSPFPFLTTDQLDEIRKTTLAKVYCENADDITFIQERVMEMPFREAFPKFE